MQATGFVEGSETKRRAEDDLPEGALSNSTNGKRTKVEHKGPTKPDDPMRAAVPGNVQQPAPQVVTTAADLVYDLGNIFEPLPADRRAFAAFTSLPTAPNPCLEIAGLGGVGLPLSSRDADALKYCSTSPASVKPDPASTRWELPPTAVRARNLAFGQYLRDTVRPEACKLLSTAAATSDIVFEKLVIHGPSSTPSTFAAAEERRPNAYAHIALSLPAAWTGSSMTSSLGVETVELGKSLAGEFQTSASIWHYDTVHSLSPLTSGYRLTLLYSLVHNSSPETIPTVLDTSTQELSLEETFIDWLAAPHVLEKAAIILNSTLPLTFATLRDGDETKVGLIKRAAKKRGFQVYLAQITVVQEGMGSDCVCAAEVDERNNEREERRENGEYGCGYGRRRGYGRRGGWGYEDEDEDEDDISDDEDVEDVCECDHHFTDPAAVTSTACVDTLTGENGSKYQITKMPLKLSELVGSPSTTAPTRRVIDREDFDLKLTWTRQALVLWPATSTDRILLSSLTAASLCIRLDNTIASIKAAVSPTQASERKRATEIADAICHSTDARAENAVKWVASVLEAAIALKDGRLFDTLARVVKGRLTPTSIKSSLIAQSVQTFGEVKVTSLLTEMLKPGPKLQSPAQPSYYNPVQALVTSRPLTTCSALLITILSDSPELIPHSSTLYASIIATDDLDVSEAPPVAALINLLGREAFERDILPLARTQKTAGFKLALVKAFLAGSKEEGPHGADCRRLATDFLSHEIVEYAPIASVPAQPYNYYGAQQPSLSVGIAWELISLSLDLNRLDFAKRTLDKILVPNSNAYTSQALRPFLVALQSNLEVRPGRAYRLEEEPFKEFVKSCVVRQVDTFQADPASIGFISPTYYTPAPTSKPRLSAFWKLFILVLDNGADTVLLDKLYTSLHTPIPSPSPPPTYFSHGLTGLAQEMMKELQARGLNASVSSKSFQTLCRSITEAAFTSGLKAWSTGVLGPQSVAPAVASVTTAIKNKSLSRVTQIANLISPSNLQTVAVPFCTRVADLAKLTPTIATEPWAEPLRKLARSTLRQVIAAIGTRDTFRSNLVIPKVGCGCPHCIPLDTFLQDDRPTLSVRDLMKVRTHLSERLRRHHLELTSETVKRGTPHTLVLTKSASWQNSASWKGRSDQARKFSALLVEAKLVATQ
ncbi:hypothetical protein P7C70_g630, partial [Phenoliferia sp. Uapishka_3]